MALSPCASVLISWGENCHQAAYKFGTGARWEGNRRSSVALALRHRHRGLSTYGLNGQRHVGEHPRICPFGPWHNLPYHPRVNHPRFHYCYPYFAASASTISTAMDTV